MAQGPRAGLKAKIDDFLLTYGRLGMRKRREARSKILADLHLGAVQPSSDNQLLPIRQHRSQQDDHEDQGATTSCPTPRRHQLAKLKAELARSDMEKQAETISQKHVAVHRGRQGRRQGTSRR